MTREVAIKAIQDFIGWFKTDSRIYKALEMAIKALSQEPICPSAGVDCEDCPAYEPCDDASRDFHIGDEVRIIGSDPIYDDCDVGWVIRNASEKVKTMYVMRNDGSADEEAKAEWYKTGRHNAMLAEVIKALPSVTQKSGKWIEMDGYDGDVYYDCSECGESWATIEGTPWDNGMKFCPNCGARMECEDKE